MTSQDIPGINPEMLYIKEQDLELINEVKPYFKKDGDLYVIIAREVNFHNGQNMGNLRTGIIKISEGKSIDDYELVLPFCTNLLYAIIDGKFIKLAYIEDRALKTKSIQLNSDRTLNPDDYAFLKPDSLTFEESVLR